MASVRPGVATIEFICPVCKEPTIKERYEYNRNVRLGRVNLCGRSCQATFMNYAPAKQAQVQAMLAERNAHQWREDNPHWKGGISGKLKPLP